MYLIILTLLAGCNFPSASNQSTTDSPFTSNPSDQHTMITFRVNIDQMLPAGESIFLNILDEVTGLPFNPQKYILNADDGLTYSVTVPFKPGSVIKYRYTREGTGVINEVLDSGSPVRYRLYHVEGSGILEDIVSRWADTEYQGASGRILGQVIDSTNERPIQNILVTAGGEQTFSLADGSFLLDGLRPGTHNLVLYSFDGSYSIFQQGAIIAGDSTTPVSVQLNPVGLVTVIFTIEVPTTTPEDAPIRLAGNLYQLGNTFTDLSGGINTLVSRMPLLGKLPDGRYIVTLQLPVGTYLEYKYTLGDGLWSSELAKDGSFALRQLLIPEYEFTENDTVVTWQNADFDPIRFEVKASAGSLSNEEVSIQFNTGFSWLEPVPMQPVTNSQGEKLWRFDLTGPFNNLQEMYYRYCWQEQCGIIDDEATTGINPEGRLFNPSSNPGVITDELK
jgi:hypothetical protein